VDQAVFAIKADAVPAGDWTHLYFGSEFCSWTFPDTKTILQALETTRRHDLVFCLVTPVVSEPFLPRLQETLKTILPKLTGQDEVIASDLGTFRLVREISNDVNLVAGRVLSGQKRGPRILDLDLNDDEVDYFQRGTWYQQEAVAFLSEYGINRIELDNLLQGIAPLPEGLTGTLHRPWAMVTLSRNCPYRETGGTGPCPGGCGQVMKLTTPQTQMPLFQAGNSQFLQNETLPENLPALGIDRIVEHQALPR
jgi:hypothetical protein